MLFAGSAVADQAASSATTAASSLGRSQSASSELAQEPTLTSQDSSDMASLGNFAYLSYYDVALVSKGLAQAFGPVDAMNQLLYPGGYSLSSAFNWSNGTSVNLPLAPGGTVTLATFITRLAGVLRVREGHRPGWRPADPVAGQQPGLGLPEDVAGESR